MEKSSSAGARALAAGALICGILILIVVVAASLGGGDSNGGGHRSNAGKTSSGSRPQQKTPAFYVVEAGDTLTSIAHRTGVSVARIQDLNPEVDPQVLVSGEKLKLR